MWDAILEPLKEKEYKDCSVLPGGNAALISNRLAKLGVNVLLGGPVGEVLAPLVDPSITTLQKHHELIGEEVNIVEDEVHLILEFSTGQEWGSLKSARANRFIISHDLQNSQLQAIESFHKAIETFHPQLIIVAGSHLLESLEVSERNIRLDVLVKALTSVPSNIAIHLEIAGVGDPTFLRQMAEKLLPLVDSIGLNEQELGALYQVTGGTTYSMSRFTSPTVPVAAGAIEHIMKLPFVNHNTGPHQISRVHLHYLSFHLLSQPKYPRAETFHWSRNRAKQAVAAGSLATTIQACGENGELPDESELHIKDNGTGEVFAHFYNSFLEFWVAPVAICNVPKRTVGLGDCISATGLATHFGE